MPALMQPANSNGAQRLWASEELALPLLYRRHGPCLCAQRLWASEELAPLRRYPCARRCPRVLNAFGRLRN